MKREFKLSASIVLYQTDPEEILSLLDILRKSRIKVLTYLVDNSDTHVDLKIFDGYQDLVYIYNGKNLGFGAAHNRAIREVLTKSDFHLILNSDISFEPGILEEIHTYMVNNPSVGLLGPKLLNRDGTLQHSAKLLPTPFDLVFRRFLPIPSIVARQDRRYELKQHISDKLIEVPSLIGCFLIISNQALEKVQGFDERFFMYMEDVDLVRRTHLSFKTLYFPKVHVFHSHGRGSYKNKKLLRYHLKSAIKYFNKWGWIVDLERTRINDRILNQFDN